MKKLFEALLVKTKQTKGSVVYGNTTIPAFYIPKDMLPEAPPPEVHIIVEEPHG